MTRELGAELTARLDPGYPRGNPVILTPRRGVDGRRPEPRRADRAGSRLDRPCGRGHRLEQLGRDRSSLGHRGSAFGRRSPPAAEHARNHLPGRALPRRSILPRGGATRHARCVHGPEQRRRLVVHERDGRRDGPVHRADRRRHVRVRGRVTAPGADRGGDRGQAPLRARAPGGSRDAPRPDRQRGAARRRRRAAGASLHGPRLSRDHAGQPRRCSTSPAAPSLVEALGEHAHPVSNLVWADRHGSIGYKTVGRLPVRRGGCPDLPKPGWTGEHEWDGWVPYDEMPEITDPDARLRGHGQQPDRPRGLSRTTSPATTWTATGRAGSSS